jgi:hypothetical protein
MGFLRRTIALTRLVESSILGPQVFIPGHRFVKTPVGSGAVMIHP